MDGEAAIARASDAATTQNNFVFMTESSIMLFSAEMLG
jgi:hypothetical protein